MVVFGWPKSYGLEFYPWRIYSFFGTRRTPPSYFRVENIKPSSCLMGEVHAKQHDSFLAAYGVLLLQFCGGILWKCLVYLC